MEAVSTVTTVSGEGILGDASFGKRNRQMLLISGDRSLRTMLAA